MANVFVTLPCPAANGAGASVNVSTMGAPKAVVVSGDANALIEIQTSNDNVHWKALATFSAPAQGVQNVPRACIWMRAFVENFKSGVAHVNVGSTDDGTSLDAFTVPASPGAGAPLVTTTLPLYKTIQVGGDFDDTITVEVSEDGTSAWGVVGTFQNPGVLTIDMPANNMRVKRDGKGGTPVVSVASTNPPGGSSGPGTLGGDVDVENQGVALANNPHSTLNFIGAGVTATDDGGGVAGVTIPGFVFVFMPAGIQTGTVYNTFADLMAAKALAQGDKLLQISNDMQFDPGGTLVFSAGTMTYTSTGGPAIPAAAVGQAVVLTGAVNPGNNGQFVVATRPSPTQITFANAAGVTETPYQGAISILGGFVAIIPKAGMPAAGWDMTDTVMMAFDSPSNPGAGGAVPTVQFGGAQSLGDVQFVNWIKTDGDLNVVNANVTLPANVIPAVGAIVDWGVGNNGSINPTLKNNGTAPMWDASGATQFTLRNNGTIGGTSPAISCGAVGPAVMSLVQSNSAQVNANMITGTNVAAIIGQTIFGDSTQLGRQPNWAGSLGQSRRGWLRTHSQPESLLQVSPVPAAAPVLFAAGAAMNATIGFNTTAADIAQILPIIRAAAPATGAIPFSTAGVLDSTGMFFTVSNVLGTHNVVVSPSGVTPDTFESGELTVIVPPNASVTFLSDGVSKWRVYSTSSRRIPTAPALRVGPGTLDITRESTLFTSNGVGNALVLPNGTYVGQKHNVIHSTVGGAGNTGIITPATPGGNFVTSTLTNHWDFTTFQWDGTHWNIYAAGIGFVGLA